jgi:transposase
LWPCIRLFISRSTIDPVGFDAGKKIEGIKRRILTDHQGLLLAAVVHAASVQDRDGAVFVLTERAGRFPLIATIFAEAGYQGPHVRQAARRSGHWRIEIVKRSDRINASSSRPSAGSSSRPSAGSSYPRLKVLVSAILCAISCTSAAAQRTTEGKANTSATTSSQDLLTIERQPNWRRYGIGGVAVAAIARRSWMSRTSVHFNVYGRAKI